jgi:broad specificity phosphatase PhoE
MTTELYLIRHGESVANVEPIIGVWVPRTRSRHLISAFASSRARYSPNCDQHDRSLWLFDSSI